MNTSERLMSKISIAILLISFFGSCKKETSDPIDHSLAYPTLSTIDPKVALGVVWEEIPGNPRIEQPPCPAWNCLANTDPWVSVDADGKMVAWFTSGGIILSYGDFVVEGPVVGRAVVDSGLNFTINPIDQPVLKLRYNVWDRYRETVSLHWDDAHNHWIMWYLGYSLSFFDDPGFGQIYSTDIDGKRWTESSEPIYRPAQGSWDFAFITSPRFLKVSDDEWRIYYSGSGTTVGIGILVSNDQGQTWNPHASNPVFERDLTSWDQGILIGTVIYHKGKFLMWYGGYKEPLDLGSTPIYIGLAVSDDGVQWERSLYNPVTGPNKPGTWNDLRMVSPHIVVMEDGSFLMFAHAQSMANVENSMGKIGVWQSKRYD